ncbi:MAG: class I SAM-dependent methyltransferase [Gemmatimonadaceae bacterium]
MTVLSVREAYRLWAPAYDRETAVSALEAETVESLGVLAAGRALLDVGCGTGRRLRASGASLAVGVDLSTEMLSVARGETVIAGDLRAIPAAAKTFDVVWCRLAIGHVRELAVAYAELARVCRPGGTVVVTDLSPDAAAAGHRRTFRDDTGATYEVEHHVHTVDAHTSAATTARLEMIARRDGVVGPGARRFYAEAGRLFAYDAQVGQPIVLALAWRKLAS